MNSSISSSNCPCGNGPMLEVYNTGPGTNQTEIEEFSLTSFGTHLVHHLKGETEFSSFRNSVSKYIGRINQNRHKAKDEDNPTQLLRSISILKRTCEKIKSQSINSLYQTINADDADNTEDGEDNKLLSWKHVQQAHKNMTQAVDFLEREKASIKGGDGWCSIQ